VPFETELAGVEARCHLVEVPDQATGIVEFQQQSGADLVVLGTRGRTSLRALLLGATAEYVLRESKCSLLAIKPEGFDYQVD
jgi:universal stress protein E